MKLGMTSLSVARFNASIRSFPSVVDVRNEFSAARPFLHGSRQPRGQLLQGPTHPDGIGGGVQGIIGDHLAPLDRLKKRVVDVSSQARAFRQSLVEADADRCLDLPARPDSGLEPPGHRLLRIRFMNGWTDTTIVRRPLAVLLCTLATACGMSPDRSLPVYTTEQTDSAHAGYRRTTVSTAGAEYVNDLEEQSLQIIDTDPKQVVGRSRFGNGKIWAIDGQDP